ncbi:MAG: DMT family transporter [Acidimicrobiia bacterium]
MTRLTALVGVLGISFAAIFVRLADVAPTTAAFFRTSYAFPLLLVAWRLVRHRDQRPAASRGLAFVSGILLGADFTLWHNSIDRIGAGPATVLANTQVVFVGLAAWMIWRERPSRTTFWIIPVVFLGVSLLSGLGRADAYGDDPFVGVLFGVATGIAYAGFLLIFRASNRHYLAPSVGPLLDATAGAVLGAFAAGLVDTGFSLQPAWPAHGWLVALAIVAQTLGWLLISVAIPRLPALDTSVMLLVQPVATIIWAYLIFEESLSLVQWGGVALVLGGIVALSLRGTVERATEPVSAVVPDQAT